MKLSQLFLKHFFMKRRSFIGKTAAATLALTHTSRLFALEADNVYRKDIGIQLYTLRNELGKDPLGTLKQVAAAGYQQVELYGFPDAKPLIEGANEAGLAVNSAHFDWETVTNPEDPEFSDFLKILDQAKALNLSHLVIPYLKDHNRGSLDAYRKVAENANKAAVLARQAGIQLAYHNHNFEFEPKEGGKSGFDILIEEFSPEMHFEIDVFWVKAAGLDPIALIQKLTSRVSQLHLKDLKQGSTIPSYSSMPEAAYKELGNGIIPMEPIMIAAAAAGVKHCHVEQDHSPDPIASIQESMAYLQKL